MRNAARSAAAPLFYRREGPPLVPRVRDTRRGSSPRGHSALQRQELKPTRRVGVLFALGGAFKVNTQSRLACFNITKVYFHLLKTHFTNPKYHENKVDMKTSENI